MKGSVYRLGAWDRHVWERLIEVGVGTKDIMVPASLQERTSTIHRLHLSSAGLWIVLAGKLKALQLESGLQPAFQYGILQRVQHSKAALYSMMEVLCKAERSMSMEPGHMGWFNSNVLPSHHVLNYIDKEQGVKGRQSAIQ